MAFTNYTIVPEDGVVVIDGQVAQNVSMTGIPANVHAIQWYGLRGSGTIEYKVDPVTGELPAPGSFTDPSLYVVQTDEAEAIIYAANNPVTYYSTANGNVHQGITYSLGSPIIVDTPNTPQPAETTTVVPPTPESFQQLYWYEGAWVISSVDPTLSLAAAQAFLIAATQTSSASNVDNQSRIYSNLQLATEADPGTLPCADNAATDLATYQSSMDSEVTIMVNTINAATAVPDLYSFDPIVDPVF